MARSWKRDEAELLAIDWPCVGAIDGVRVQMAPGVYGVALRRRTYAIVGHWRRVHIEAGPFASLVEADRAWRRMVPGLEEHRRAVARSRAGGGGGEPPGTGPGWRSQGEHRAVCPECGRRVDRRAATAAAASPDWDGDPPGPGPLERPAPGPGWVRRARERGPGGPR